MFKKQGYNENEREAIAMTQSKKFLSVLFITSLLAVTGCGQRAPQQEEDPEIFKVDEAQFRAAVTFSNINFYKYRQVAGGITMDNEVNNVREIVYSEKTKNWNSWYMREYGYCYLFDWQPSENIYFKYRTREVDENDEFAINTVQYYTKDFQYNDFTYQEEKKAYYQELPEYSSIGGAPVRRVYLYFKYQKLIKSEFFVYMDTTDWQDRIITVDHSYNKDLTMRGVQYLDKGNLSDNI